MPMLDIQRRHAEVFRIRLGEKGSKGEPRKLTDSIRITSPSRAVVDAFAEVFGGTPQPWNGNGSQQFEVYLPVTEIPVMVLPGQSIQQWWELYRGSVCERRCDGFTETLSGKPCMCDPEITVRQKSTGQCSPMTRLNVLCPDVEVVGAGSLVTHGMVAAETLPQSVAVAEAALSRGLMVPAMFRVVEHKGKRHYIVPQLEITGVSLHALTTGEVTAPALASANGRALAPPAPAALESGGAASAKDEQAAGGMEAPAPSSPGANPAGGSASPSSGTTGPFRPASRPPLKKANGDKVPAGPPAAADVDPDAMTRPQNAKIHALLHGMGITDEQEQRDLIGEIIGRTVDSKGALTKTEASQAIETLMERAKMLAAAGGAK